MSQKQIFVIMPFRDSFFDVYNMIVRKLGNEFNFHTADVDDGQQNIVDDIIQYIISADAIIVDISSVNANVMYELGIAHTLGKKTIVITQDDPQELPFDIKSYRVVKYSTGLVAFDDFVTGTLKGLLENAINNTAKFNNPVKNYFDNNSITYSNFDIEPTQETEYGLLDYGADVEDGITEIANQLLIVTEETIQLTNDMDKITKKINNNSGGNGTASFIRKQARKAAILLNKYSDSLKTHNPELVKSWNILEVGYLNLLDSEYVVNQNNYETLKSNKAAFDALYNSMQGSLEKLTAFKQSFESLQNLQKELTYATRLVDDELSNLINFVQTMGKGITFIVKKSNSVTENLESVHLENTV
jgi:hypothetical protein